MARRRRIRVTHVITGLEAGGAEMMLLKLLSHADRDTFAFRVYSLSVLGFAADRIAALGIPVRSLSMRRDLPNPGSVLRLSGYLRQDSPDLVQTWMYHANLVGGLATKLAAARTPVVWNIRHSTLDPTGMRRRTVHVVRACAPLSRWLPHTIITCSRAARSVHAALGYRDEKMKFIPNGFDLSQFRPDPDARRALRDELGLAPSATIIGQLARFHPQKDHRTFMDAAAQLHGRRPDVHFVLCGIDIEPSNTRLDEWMREAGLGGVCHLLGHRRDSARVTAGFDIATSSSAFGEGFPNVLGEAMACEVPCATTDVGDSAYVLGDTGRVVPPRDPRALAGAWDELLGQGPDGLRALGRRARRRVETEFSIDVIVRAYEDTYKAIVKERAHRSSARRALAGAP